MPYPRSLRLAILARAPGLTPRITRPGHWVRLVAISAKETPVRPLERARSFCARHHLDVPILLAPMAGVPATSLSIAVAHAGGMGALGALVSDATAIREWVSAFRRDSRGAFQLNTWVPDPAPRRDAEAEARVRAFLERWGPPVPLGAGDVSLPDFQAQCDAFIEAQPSAVSSIMGLFPPSYVARLKQEASPGLPR